METKIPPGASYRALLDVSQQYQVPQPTANAVLKNSVGRFVRIWTLSPDEVLVHYQNKDYSRTKRRKAGWAARFTGWEKLSEPLSRVVQSFTEQGFIIERLEDENHTKPVQIDMLETEVAV